MGYPFPSIPSIVGALYKILSIESVFGKAITTLFINDSSSGLTDCQYESKLKSNALFIIRWIGI